MIYAAIYTAVTEADRIIEGEKTIASPKEFNQLSMLFYYMANELSKPDSVLNLYMHGVENGDISVDDKQDTLKKLGNLLNAADQAKNMTSSRQIGSLPKLFQTFHYAGLNNGTSNIEHQHDLLNKALIREMSQDEVNDLRSKLSTASDSERSAIEKKIGIIKESAKLSDSQPLEGFQKGFFGNLNKELLSGIISIDEWTEDMTKKAPFKMRSIGRREYIQDKKEEISSGDVEDVGSSSNAVSRPQKQMEDVPEDYFKKAHSVLEKVIFDAVIGKDKFTEINDFKKEIKESNDNIAKFSKMLGMMVNGSQEYKAMLEKIDGEKKDIASSEALLEESLLDMKKDLSYAKRVLAVSKELLTSGEKRLHAESDFKRKHIEKTDVTSKAIDMAFKRAGVSSPLSNTLKQRFMEASRRISRQKIVSSDTFAKQIFTLLFGYLSSEKIGEDVFEAMEESDSSFLVDGDKLESLKNFTRYLAAGLGSAIINKISKSNADEGVKRAPAVSALGLVTEVAKKYPVVFPDPINGQTALNLIMAARKILLKQGLLNVSKGSTDSFDHGDIFGDNKDKSFEESDFGEYDTNASEELASAFGSEIHREASLSARVAKKILGVI